MMVMMARNFILVTDACFGDRGLLVNISFIMESFQAVTLSLMSG